MLPADLFTTDVVWAKILSIDISSTDNTVVDILSVFHILSTDILLAHVLLADNILADTTWAVTCPLDSCKDNCLKYFISLPQFVFSGVV